MLRTLSLMRSFSTATEAIKSVPGNKPPALADNPAGRYAGALFTSASKNEALHLVMNDVKHLGEVLKTTDVLKIFIKNSAIKRSQQKDVFRVLASQGYHQLTMNFLDTLIDSGRLSDLEKVIETYINYCKILNKEEDIRVISAKVLSQDEKDKVIAAIRKGRPDVRFKLSFEEDSTILGGLQIYAGRQFLDCSLRTRVDRLKSELNKIA